MASSVKEVSQSPVPIGSADRQMTRPRFERGGTACRRAQPKSPLRKDRDVPITGQTLSAPRVKRFRSVRRDRRHDSRNAGSEEIMILTAAELRPPHQTTRHNVRDHPVRGVRQPLPKRFSRTRRASHCYLAIFGSVTAGDRHWVVPSIVCRRLTCEQVLRAQSVATVCIATRFRSIGRLTPPNGR